MRGLPSNARYCEWDEFSQEFDESWYKLERRFFKLERIQTYQQPESPSWNAFIEGDWERAMKLLEAQYREENAPRKFAVQHDIEMVRVHVVERPPSDYLWWEFRSYVFTAQAGQRILIADLDEVRDIDEKYQLSDFVLFDETVVWVHDYRDGLLRGAWKTMDPDFLRVCSSAAEELMARSVSFEEFCDRERPGWRRI